jgi:single-stranded-DNA-specific exonuclease
LSVKLENLDALIKRFNDHCEQCISDDHLIKSVSVDTRIYEHERDNHTLTKIDKLAPFGEGNEEPIFLLENVSIQKIEKVGTKGKCHLKIHGTFGKKKLTTMFRGR